MPVAAYETAITDTTGYVVLSATDSFGVSSLINGNNFPGGAPVAGKDYLVNAGRTIRTPESGSPFTFKGDSLTLDGVPLWRSSARVARRPSTTCASTTRASDRPTETASRR